MRAETQQQIVISGVGGQGVLFITRLLAEAAMTKGLSVLTSETHGMAQRGGTVISHLKVGDFTGPLIMPGDAGGLIALKTENVTQHSRYLKPDAWAVVNSAAPLAMPGSINLHYCDAERLARDIKNPRALNLIMLGFALADRHGSDSVQPPLYCGMEDIAQVLEQRLKGNKELLHASITALGIGAQSGASV